jgi:hypothetical protein
MSKVYLVVTAIGHDRRGTVYKKITDFSDNRQLEGFQPLSPSSTGFKSNS